MRHHLQGRANYLAGRKDSLCSLGFIEFVCCLTSELSRCSVTWQFAAGHIGLLCGNWRPLMIDNSPVIPITTPDCRTPAWPAFLVKLICRQVQVGRKLLAQKIRYQGRLSNRLGMSGLQCFKDRFLGIFTTGSADFPELRRCHCFKIYTRRAELRTVKDRFPCSENSGDFVNGKVGIFHGSNE